MRYHIYLCKNWCEYPADWYVKANIYLKTVFLEKFKSMFKLLFYANEMYVK